MYEIPGDYLMTYDPAYTEEHSDSSDFEESCIPLISKKRGNHSLFNKRPYKQKTPAHFNYEYPVKLQKEQWDTKAVQVDKRKKHNFNSGDQPQPAQSKLSLIRQKVIPCLSHVFRRSTKQDMSIIHESQQNPRECEHCERRRIKKLYKRQNYAVQPVYAIEGNIHKPVPFTPKTEPLHKHKKFKNQYSTCSISTTSESETQMEKMKAQSLKMKKRFKKEVMKEHWKYQRQLVKNQRHQYPSKDHQSPYQVFTSPYQQSRTNVSPSDSQYTSEMPATSSGFWEYLFDKINRKYQVQKMEMPRPCNCSSGELPCSPSNCEKFEPKAEPSGCQGRQQSSVGNSCSCAPKPEPPSGGCCQKSGPSETLPPFNFHSPSQISKNSLSLKMKPPAPEKKVHCKCFDKSDARSDARSTAPSKASRLPSQPLTTKPCQEGHDNITAALADKYNGEILCIHNPPCILINGCLNLPQPKDSPQTNCWPVSESKKSAFNYKKKSKNSPKCEQACQYHVPYVEVRQCQTPEYNVEKKIQSICHHNPPCEVVRGCYKSKYDPRLQSSCVHVPMCQKIPQCAIDRDRTCEHKPRCPELPVCSRNYTVLTARENFGAQVKPKPALICRHIPPCIMIPRCLGRAICDYIPSGAIPDCNHQPVCEMIPACCRRCTREMVSVSSQYPNSCRIV